MTRNFTGMGNRDYVKRVKVPSERALLAAEIDKTFKEGWAKGWADCEKALIASGQLDGRDYPEYDEITALKNRPNSPDATHKGK